MKKSIFVFTTILMVTLFSGCIINGNTQPSYYMESWDSTDGYVVVDEEGNFSEFKSGTKDKPANQSKAVMYEHRYNSSSGYPTYILTPQNWNDENIEYENIESAYRFSFSKKPRNINGFIFYCDDENIYIINNKYDVYRDKERRDNDEYRFKIRVYGVKDELEFKMVLREQKSNW